jgi:uncharacterized YccA/Bax inhibitor family protein
VANPVLTRPDAFAPAQTPQTYGPTGPYTQTDPYAQQPYAQTDPYAQQAYAQTGPYAQQPYGQPAPVQPDARDRMTLDDVLTKTAVILGAVVVVAVLTWRFLGDNMPVLLSAGTICGLAAFIFPLVGAFRRSIGPVFSLIYGVIEGVFLGAISGLFEMYFPGIVFQAVVATLIAAAVTLAAFHFGKVRLTPKIQKILLISLISYAAVALVNFVLSLAGIDLGLISSIGASGKVGLLAWGFALLGVVLAVVSLVDDFQHIEEGIRQGAPAKASWVAAYGLSVTMVFLYIQLLRILSYLRR